MKQALVILALLAPLLLAVRPVYRWGKGWRARSLAGEAETLMVARQWQDAAGKAQAAYQLAPTEAAALRAIAHLYTAAGMEGAHRFWKNLVSHPGVTLEDRRGAAAFALQSNRLAMADEQLRELLRAEPYAPKTLELAARLAAQKNDRSTALRFLRRLLEKTPGDFGARLFEGHLLLASPEPAERTEGVRLLQDFAKSAAPNSLQTLELLALDRNLPAAEARAVADSLDAHPGSKPEHHFAATGIRMRLEPAQRAALIDRAAAQFGASGPDALVALARWLMQQGEPARVLELVPPEAARTRQELLLVRLDALASLNRWQEIQQVLEAGTKLIDTFYAEVFQARAAMELGEQRAAELHWSRALVAAGQKTQSLQYLTQYATKTGAPRIAEKAWRQLAREPAWALRANLALVPLLEAQNDTRGLRDVMKRLVALSPGDPAPRNDAAYLDLLLEENIAAAKRTAEQLVHDHLTVLAHHTTLALAHLRSGEPAAARRVTIG